MSGYGSSVYGRDDYGYGSGGRTGEGEGGSGGRFERTEEEWRAGGREGGRKGG